MARTGKELHQAYEALASDDEKKKFLAGLTEEEFQLLNTAAGEAFEELIAGQYDEDEEIIPFDSLDKYDPHGNWMRASWFRQPKER